MYYAIRRLKEKPEEPDYVSPSKLERPGTGTERPGDRNMTIGRVETFTKEAPISRFDTLGGSHKSGKKAYVGRSATLQEEISPEKRFDTIQLRVEQFLYKTQLSIPVFYELIDTDKSQSIDKDEFIERLVKAKLGINKSLATEFFNYVDSDGNGSLCYKEFATAFKDINVRQILWKLKKLYKTTDGLRELFGMHAESKGYLTRDDVGDLLQNIMNDIQRYEKLHVFEALDRADKNGQITLETWLETFSKLDPLPGNGN